MTTTTTTATQCCSVCGREASDRIPLQNCRRVDWPPCPKMPLPDFEKVTKEIPDYRQQSRAWDEAWKVHASQTEKTPCCSSTHNKICLLCVSKPTNPGGCSLCKQWECATCHQDQETPRIFEEVHEKSPFTLEDEYGRRGRSEQHALKLDRCFACRRQGCCACLTRCYGPCDRPMCWQCQNQQGGGDALTTACGDCKFIMDNNDDGCIGPQDRDECYCASCFYGRGKPMFCGCGKPSYDPFEENEDEENEEEYDARMVISSDFLEGATRWKHAAPLTFRRGKYTTSWEDSYRRFCAGESPQEIAMTGRQRPIQYTTVIHHILQAVVHGNKPDLSRLVKFAPTAHEWEALEEAEETVGVDVTSAPDTKDGMICGKMQKSGLLRRIVDAGIMNKKPAQRSVPERAKVSRWYHCQEWYLTLRRVGVAPTFE